MSLSCILVAGTLAVVGFSIFIFSIYEFPQDSKSQVYSPPFLFSLHWRLLKSQMNVLLLSFYFIMTSIPTASCRL